mgnify:FL=1
MLVMIKGAGDLASGIACCLIRAGHQVIMTEIARPTVVRRTVSFAVAAEQGNAQLEEIRGRLADSPDQALAMAGQGIAAVLIDPETRCLKALQPDVLVDAIIAKHNTGTCKTDAPLVIAIGPGFVAGEDCHAAVESQRGPNLGQVLWQGSPEPDSGVPGPVLGYDKERIIRAPGDGVFIPLAAIGDIVEKGRPVARVGDQLAQAQLTGLVRGMLAKGTIVTKGMKSGDIDPRIEPELCYHISDKALAIGEGVLQAIKDFGGWSHD